MPECLNDCQESESHFEATDTPETATETETGEFYLPTINSPPIFCLFLPFYLEIQHKMEINTVLSGLQLGRFEFGLIIMGIVWNLLETSRKF